MDLAWDILEMMLKGRSGLDLQAVPFNSLEDCERFLLNYGFDWHHPEHQQELLRIQAEAIRFVEERFLQSYSSWDHFWADTELFTVPREFKYMDTPELLLKAADHNPDKYQQAWACAFLKLIHVITHVESSFYSQFVEEARAQIIPRFEGLLFCHAKTGKLCLGKPDSGYLPIVDFQIKDAKSRDSLITKLICKKESIAEQVLDLIGVRIVTETPTDAILALEILRQNRVVIFANLIPSRSRNTLIDFDPFKEKAVDAKKAQTVFGQSHPEAIQDETGLDILRAITATAVEKKMNDDNRASHIQYRAIHLTARQLVRLEVTETNANAQRIFFPYEIQVVDKGSHNKNQAGDSAHRLYKKKQLFQARHRILKGLLQLARDRKKERLQLV